MRQTWPTTHAADGLPRLAWTVDDLDRMVAAGILPEGGGIELLWGELVPMPAKGIRHETVRSLLLDRLTMTKPRGVIVASELGWRPADDVYLEPELLLAQRTSNLPLLQGADVLLLIEVADSSLAYDTGLKAGTYAKLGVRDYWVVSAATLDTRVFRSPSAVGYADITRHSADEVLTPLFLPGMALRIADAVAE